jgi:hypothetical protein
MDDTLTLTILNTPQRGQIAHHAVVALALRAGLPPLAADRAAAAVADVVQRSPAEAVRLTATLDESAVIVTLSGGDPAWCRDTAEQLADLGARADSGQVQLRLERTPLRAV